MLHPHTFEIYEPYDHFREFLLSLPQRFSRGEGECIYKGRNELRVFTVNGTRLVVKSFGRPHFINQLVYGFLRPAAPASTPISLPPSASAVPRP